VCGFAVEVQAGAAIDGGWAEQACVEAAAKLTRDRVRYGYRPATQEAGA